MSDLYGSSPQNIDILSVLVAGTANLVIAFVLFTLFSLIRPKYKRIYEPKTLFSHPDKRLQKVPRGPLSWARICVDVDETLLVKKIGLDAIVFLQFVLVVGKLLGVMTVLSLVLILVNYFAPTIDKVTHWQAIDFNVSISTISIENISRGSGLFYLYSICCYIYSGYAYYLFYSMWINFKRLKEQYYLLEAGNLNSRILAFTSLTEQYKNSSELELYITEKCHTTPVTMLYDRDCSRLLKILNKHSSSVRKVERILTEYLGNPAIQRPTQKINKKLRICTVDAIDYYKVKIDNLETIIYSSRAMGDEQFEKSSCCFVEFQEIKQAHGILKYFNPSTNLMKLTKLLEPNVKLCPPFIDIIWSNIGLAPAVAKARRMGAVLATIAVTIFWFFVIALAQLLSTIITSSRFENVDGFVKAVLVFLQSFASPAIMAFLNILIILVLRQITIQQGVVSKTGVERSTLLKFFVFQTYQIIARLGVEVIKAYLENFVTGKASTDQLDKLLKSVISNCVAVIIQLISNPRFSSHMSLQVLLISEWL